MKRLFLDTETTGLSCCRNRICSLTILDDCDECCTFMFDPEQPVESGASAVNGYTWSSLRQYPTFAAQARRIKAILDSADVLIAHNASFDIGFLKNEFARCGIYWTPKCVECTMLKAKRTLNAPCYKLDYLTGMLGLKNLRGRYHGSLEDTVMCKALYYELDSYSNGTHKRRSYPSYTNSTYTQEERMIQNKQSNETYPKYTGNSSMAPVWIWGGFILFIILCAL